MARYGRAFLWTGLRFYMPTRKLWEGLVLRMLQKYGGPFDQSLDKPVDGTGPTTVQPTAAAKA